MPGSDRLGRRDDRQRRCRGAAVVLDGDRHHTLLGHRFGDRDELKGVAATIGANESRHLAILSNIAAGTIVSGPSFPKALTAAQASKAVTPFLG